MTVYAVGDIQGCFDPLQKLLKKVEFDPQKDQLWCCGDIVNRGEDSLKVLRYLKSLGDACICVLGNHDFQLLAYAAGGKSFAGDTLDQVLEADDAEELIDWLRFRPMLHYDETLNWCMVHAGLSPLWSLNKAQKRAHKIEKMLQGDHWQEFCRKLQKKRFAPRDDGEDKLNRKMFSAAVFTRTRFCSSDGVFDWDHKTSDSKDKKFRPWFAHKHAKWRKDCKVVYGHWAARGLVADQKHVLGLDTGCVWGGSLTMAKLKPGKTGKLVSSKCKVSQEIGS